MIDFFCGDCANKFAATFWVYCWTCAPEGAPTGLVLCTQLRATYTHTSGHLNCSPSIMTNDEYRLLISAHSMD